LFVEELTAAFDIVGRAPHIGRLYRQSPILNTRRVLLKGTGYHVYYLPLALRCGMFGVAWGRPFARHELADQAWVS